MRTPNFAGIKDTQILTALRTVQANILELADKASVTTTVVAPLAAPESRYSVQRNTVDISSSVATAGDTDISAMLNAGVNNIVATAASSTTKLAISSTSLLAADVNSVYGGYSAWADTNNTRTAAIGLNSAGIAMGFNDVDGTWKNAVYIGSDGSFVFGHTAGKQISWDATNGEMILGSNTRISTAGGGTISDAYSYAVSGYNISQALTVSGTTTLKGVIQPTDSGAIKVGSITWNSSTGALTGGSGIAITEAGIIGASSGATTFSIDTAGNATFAGALNAATGTFAGDVVTTGKIVGYGFTSYDGNDSTGVLGYNAVTGGGHGVYGLWSPIIYSILGGAGVRGAAVFSYGYGVHGSTSGSNSSSVGVYAEASNAAAIALKAVNSGGGTAISTTGNVYVTGSITASSNVTAYSDLRLKENLVPIGEALGKVNQLTGYTYTRTDTGERQTGLIAQDLQSVLPEAVMDGEYLSVAYGNVVGLLVEAIKELDRRTR